MRFLIGFIRFLLFALASTTLIGYFLLSGIFLGHSIERGFKLRMTYIKVMMAILNVRVEVFGQLPDKNFKGFLVANHRSYFDPVAILKFVDAVTVAKSQISHWPAVGLGARLVGVIWVKRDEKDSRKAARNKMLETVKAGYNVLIFPEGTSHTEAKMLEVRNATFDMAAGNNIPVLPIAIEYSLKSDAWVGNDTFVRHFFACFGKWQTRVGIYFGTPLRDSDALALKTQAVNIIDTQVVVLRNKIAFKEQG